MKVEQITVGAFAMNAYLVYDEHSGDAFYVDPGAEAEKLISIAEHLQVHPKMIINTHCHIDHAGEAKTVQEHFGIPFYIHREEEPLLDSLAEQALMFGMKVDGTPKITDYLNDGQNVECGSLQIKVLFTPGHSPGGISFLVEDHVFVGDCLFMDSIGRTDLYGGSYDTLINSIRNKLLTLTDGTIVHSGHGPDTTIGRERQFNPFLTQ